jgi:DNA-binding SARP family transcriptional activator
MKFQVLGDLRVIDQGVTRSISAPKKEATLAALLLRANQVISIEQMIGEVWGERPPSRATSALHVYISQLRKTLGDSDPVDGPIVTRSPGYLLRVERDELDSMVFDRLARTARDELLRGRPDQAGAAASEALGLCRGPVLSKLRNGPIVAGFAAWVEEIRLECLEIYFESNLACGRHRESVGLLYQRIAEHPLHEVFYGQLMRALQYSERRGDALAVYQMARDVLNRELGLEPSPRLRGIQQEVLTAGHAHVEHRPRRLDLPPAGRFSEHQECA